MTAFIINVAKWLSFTDANSNWLLHNNAIALLQVDDAAVHSHRIIACTQQQCNHGLINSKRWQLLLFLFLVFRFLLWLCCFSFGMPFGLHLLLDLRWQLLRFDEATSDGAARVFVRVPCFFLFFACCSGEFCWVSADSIINSAAAWAKQWSISVFDPWTIYIAWRTTMRGWW